MPILALLKKYSMEPTYLHDGDEWMLAEHIPNCDLFFSTIWLQGFVDAFEKHTGRAYKKMLCRYEDYNLWFYYGKKDSDEVGEHLADLIIGTPGFAKEINDNIIKEADKLRAFSETIPQEREELTQLSDEELWSIYSTHHSIHQEYYTWGWIPVCVDMFHGNLTKRMKTYLKEHGVSNDALNEKFVILTQPIKQSLIVIEQEELLAIGIAIEKNKELRDDFVQKNVDDILNILPEDIQVMFQEHTNKYYYTKHLWVSGEYKVRDYVTQIKDIFATGELPSIILKKQTIAGEKAITQRSELLDTLAIDDTWRAIFDGYGEFMVTKMYRRYAQLLAVHHMSPVLKEIAKRKHITEKQVRFATVEDTRKMLLEDNVDEEELLRRAQRCVYYAEKGFSKVYTGAGAAKMEKDLVEKIDETLTELSGETGCLGYGKGPVKIIIRAEDMEKMNQGDVLVSIATDPDIVPAMKKASAIVTEQGGVTSHAAIVSRELGIPCVIGTKIATKIFKDGDIVEVDANMGVVRKLL